MTQYWYVILFVSVCSCSGCAILLQDDRFDYVEDWGEELAGKYQSVVCVLNLTCESVMVIEEGLEHVSCGQVR